MGRRKTTEEVIEEAKLIHGEKYIYDDTIYINNKTKMKIICPIHGEFWQLPQDHLRGRGCSKCNGGVSHTNEKWIEKFNTKHGNTYSYELINKKLKLSSNTKIPIICKEHGVFYQSCINHSIGQGCPKCANIKNGIDKNHTNEKFKELSLKIHGDKYIYDKVNYINNHTEVCIICPKHGEFYQKPNVHLLGHGCPKCASSLLENELIELFNYNNIEYIHRAKRRKINWIDTLELDFYLPKYKIAIECQGIEHFKPINFFGGEKKYKSTLERDKKKLKLCEENGVKLLYYSNLDIEYPYEVFEDKEELLKEILNG